MIDYTVTIGNLISFVGLLVGGIVFLIRVESKLNILIHEKHMEQEATVRKFTEIDEQLRRLAEAIIQIAKQEVRLDGLDTRLGEVLDKVRDMDETGTKYHKDRYPVMPPRKRTSK